MYIAIDFAVGGNFTIFDSHGWSSPEVAGTWSVGAESSIKLPISLVEPHRLTLQLAGCMIPGRDGPQPLEIIINGSRIESRQISHEEMLEFVIPAESEPQRTTEISFRHPDFRVPLECGQHDGRALAIRFKKLRLEAVSAIERREAQARKLPQVLMIGQSHMAAVERASILREIDDQVVLRLKFFSLMGRDRWVWWEDGFHYDPELVSQLSKLVSVTRFDAVISMLGGNAHFVRGAINHPRRFDFVIPGRPDLKPVADAELVPYDLVFARAKYDVEAELGVMPVALESSTCPLFHIAAPPPVEDDQILIRHLLQHRDSEPGRRMERDIEQFGISSPEFRLKLWLVYSHATRETCREYGIIYIEPPASTSDHRGYILPQFASDSLHGTDDYGQLVISDIAARLGRANT